MIIAMMMMTINAVSKKIKIVISLIYNKIKSSPTQIQNIPRNSDTKEENKIVSGFQQY